METKTVKQKLVCFVLVNKVLVWITLWDRSNCRNYHWEPLVRCCGKGGSLTAAAHRWMWRGTSHRAFPTQPWGFASQEIHIQAESWPGTEAVQLRWRPCTGLRGPGALTSCCHCWPPLPHLPSLPLGDSTSKHIMVVGVVATSLINRWETITKLSGYYTNHQKRRANQQQKQSKWPQSNLFSLSTGGATDVITRKWTRRKKLFMRQENWLSWQFLFLKFISKLFHSLYEIIWRS